MKELFALICTGALMLSSPVNAAEFFFADNGQLARVNGVSVAGVLYDVEFVDGSCVALFSGCDASSDFNFSTAALAEQAASSLFDQVLIDGPLGLFDSNPNTVVGCMSFVCNIRIPNQSLGNLYVSTIARNWNSNRPDLDGITSSVIPRDVDLSIDNTQTFAIFRASITAVPEPATWAILVLGFFGVASTMRTARRKQNVRLGYA